MSRIPYIQSKNYTGAQKRLCERITGGKRSKGRTYESFFTATGGLRGPFNAYLYSPVIGEAAQRLGEAVRFESSIPPKLREIAILTVAAKWKAQYEWWAHERIGRQLGIEERVIKSLKAGEQPQFKTPAEASVFAFCRELLENESVSDRLYAASVELLGEAGVVELVMLVGYYITVAMILNVFEVPVPDGQKAPFTRDVNCKCVKKGE
jgi:4-carboxymuconolactone decarboxylase